MGPALCFGNQGRNLWLQYGDRAFLVPPELCRMLSPDEECAEHPELRLGIDQLRQAVLRDEYEDHIGVVVDPEELDHAAEEDVAIPHALNLPEPPEFPETGDYEPFAPGVEELGDRLLRPDGLPEALQPLRGSRVASGW